MTVAVQLLIGGIVQGVGYRYWSQRIARGLGLSGWSRNLHDGRVEIFAEGEPAAIDELERRCHEGPRSAEVMEVLRASREPRGLSDFAITGDAAQPEPR